MLCAAATDPYTSCGFRKLVCVSDIGRFLVHHLSDRYAGRVGLPLTAFREQLATLADILDGSHPATTLCNVESRLARAPWSKSYYERPSDAVLKMVPAAARTILSVGCGSGATEVRLKQRGAEVTALPLSSVIGASAARLGIRPVYGTLDECLTRLDGERYDCVVISRLLHLQRDPLHVFNRCAHLTGAGGVLVVDSPNFARLSTVARRILHLGDHHKLRRFEAGGISTFGPGRLVRAAIGAGFAATNVSWYNHALPGVPGLKDTPLRLGRLTARSWVLRASRDSERRIVPRSR
jgi:SAM-dependent methyltransferase